MRVLLYDLALPYAASVDDVRTLPRLSVGVDFFPGQAKTWSLAPLLDSGADMSLFDGDTVEQAGLPMDEVIRRALDVTPISGLGLAGRPMLGYLHEVTCYVLAGSRFAELRMKALITPPNTLHFPVLGRAGFFDRSTSPSWSSRGCSTCASATRRFSEGSPNAGS